jgi:hypothetical protein
MQMTQDSEEGLKMLSAIHRVTQALCAHAERGEIDRVDELLRERERLLGRLPEFFSGARYGDPRSQNPDAQRSRSSNLVEAIAQENQRLVKLLHERKTSIVAQMREIRLSKHLTNYAGEVTP